MGAMNTEKQLSPEGELIEAARERMGLSQNAAAREINLSGTRWRQIIKGTGTAEGVRVAVRGGPDTVAKMAALVGLTAQDMEGVGREDVARRLADAAPQPSSRWDGEIAGPTDVLYDDEDLRWRDEGKGRWYRYTLDGIEHAAMLEAGTPPEEAVLTLRKQFADRVMGATGKLMGRPQALAE